MSDLIIYKDLLIDLFNLSDADIHSIRHENQNGKTLIFVTLVSHPFDCPSCGNSHIKIKGMLTRRSRTLLLLTVPASFVIAPDAMSVLSAVQLIMKGILLSSTV